MAYSLTRADLNGITDAELARSTEKLLPKWDEIPEEFRNGNLYTQVADARLHDYPLPGISISFLPGFENEGAGEALDRCVTAHLNAFAVKHEHKMAAVGYMISKICKVTVV
ncbi:hypothetical protein AB4156_35225 [Cupriavidus sp. 2MCAB6]|uniref:hypothetical protein n=1 Tax=Cupriavidus sp. 2MCAB6 TaxID=3232981 RepID=UPI003F903ED7